VSTGAVATERPEILLAHAYYLHGDPHEQAVMKPYPPLGILSVAAYLKAQGFRTDVFDSTFSTPEEFRERVERTRPPVVGISCNLMTRRAALEMIRVCKAVGAIVVAGGPEPAVYAQEYLAGGTDVVVIGEGELTLEELLPHLARHRLTGMKHIKGLAFRDESGRLVYTEPRPLIADLDSLPFPDFAAIDVPQYLQAWRGRHGMGSLSLITARGCPYTCSWCSHAVFGNTHRRRSPQHVADELQLIVETYGPDMVWYADDVFTMNHPWLRRYAEELAQRGLRAPFEAISREDRLTPEIVHLLAEMGCLRLWLGAESGSQKILDAMQRRTSAQRTREMTALLQQHGIQVGMFIMLGYEGEEQSDLEATVEHLKAASPDQFLTTVAYPIKGTEYHAQVAERIVPNTEWAVGSDRDVTVLGRHSRRFYRYATRWMVNEVALHRQRQQVGPRLLRLAKAAVNTRLGRLGMRLTQHEVERGVG
jgi:anaerobic magnesium-protoporphyrin IX monomethyl ester cyclase